MGIHGDTTSISSNLQPESSQKALKANLLVESDKKQTSYIYAYGVFIVFRRSPCPHLLFQHAF